MLIVLHREVIEIALESHDETLFLSVPDDIEQAFCSWGGKYVLIKCAQRGWLIADAESKRPVDPHPLSFDRDVAIIAPVNECEDQFVVAFADQTVSLVKVCRGEVGAEPDIPF